MCPCISVASLSASDAQFVLSEVTVTGLLVNDLVRL